MYNTADIIDFVDYSSRAAAGWAAF